MTETTMPLPDGPEVEHVANLYVAGMLEPDEAQAVKLLEEAGKVFVAAVRAEWGRKLDAAQALLAAAERVIDEGEASIDPVQRERARRLADVLMDTAMATARCEF
jgi:hypothetical protein